MASCSILGVSRAGFSALLSVYLKKLLMQFSFLVTFLSTAVALGRWAVTSNTIPNAEEIHYKKILMKYLWLVLLCTAVVPACWADNPIAIVSSQALAFGSFAAGSGGSVIVSTSGARSSRGAVVLLSADGGAAASFNVSGDPNLTYAITLPADDEARLSSDGHSMALTAFTSSPAETGTLSAGGSQMLSVGATLGVVNHQAPGSYSGSFNVSVDYN